MNLAVQIVIGWAALCVAFVAWAFWRKRKLRQQEQAFREADAREEQEDAARTIGKSPHLAAPYGKRQRVRLTPQALTAVNRQRRITGRPCLSPAGFYRATVTAPADRRLESQNDWLLYYLLWNVHGHSNPYAYCQTNERIPNTLEIQPGGGEYGGGGASGMWTEDPNGGKLVENITQAAGAAAVIGGMSVPGDWGDNGNRAPSVADPLPFETPTRSNDTPPDIAPPTPSSEPPNSTSNTESSPSYSAPESSPSSTYSSSDSGSSYSGGGDSGGGGGGGGD
jgi:hypothetical protein